MDFSGLHTAVATAFVRSALDDFGFQTSRSGRAMREDLLAANVADLLGGGRGISDWFGNLRHFDEIDYLELNDSMSSDGVEHSEGEEEEGEGEETEHQEGRECQPADSSLVARLPTRRLTATEVAQLPPQAKACTICLEDFKTNSEVRTLPCLHGFHRSCVDKWLKRQGDCPNCKCRIDASILAESASPTTSAGRSRSRSPAIEEVPQRSGRQRRRRRGASSHEGGRPAASVRAEASSRGQRQRRRRPPTRERSPVRGRARRRA